MAQVRGLACFAALGLASGLLYDMLRPPRYFRGKDFFWDLLFCTVSAAACFLLSMVRGKTHIWELCSALLFFCLYINYLSPLLLPIFMGIFEWLQNCYFFIHNSLKKLQIFVKKFFTKCPD